MNKLEACYKSNKIADWFCGVSSGKAFQRMIFDIEKEKYSSLEVCEDPSMISGLLGVYFIQRKSSLFPSDKYGTWVTTPARGAELLGLLDETPSKTMLTGLFALLEQVGQKLNGDTAYGPALVRIFVAMLFKPTWEDANTMNDYPLLLQLSDSLFRALAPSLMNQQAKVAPKSRTGTTGTLRRAAPKNALPAIPSSLLLLSAEEPTPVDTVKTVELLKSCIVQLQSQIALLNDELTTNKSMDELVALAIRIRKVHELLKSFEQKNSTNTNTTK